MSYDEGTEPKSTNSDQEPEFPIYGPGLKGTYLQSANKHLKEYESELGNEDPEFFYVITEYDER